LLRLPAAEDNAAMEAEPTKADPPNRKRRWFQFSLQTLLIFTLICAVPCAWLGIRIKKARRQSASVDEIKKHGGLVVYDYQQDSSGTVNWNAEPPGPAWLRKLFGDGLFAEVESAYFGSDSGTEQLEGLPGLKELSLRSTQVTDSAMQHLAGQTQLQKLEVFRTRVTDAGLVPIEGARDLRDLSLRETHITDAGLTHLLGMNHLQSLDLSQTGVTDAGLESVARMSQLETLKLSETQVTDAGLEKLTALKNLRVLSIDGTKQTPVKVKRLRRLMPKVEIRL
jgi:Leucine-rich repeat (LRR) protein